MKSTTQSKSALGRLQRENALLREENAQLIESSGTHSKLALARFQQENEHLRKENARLKSENKKLSEDYHTFKLDRRSDRSLVKQNEELVQMLEDAIAAKDLDVLESHKKRLIDYVQAIEITCINGVQEKHALMLLICNGTRACRKYLQQIRDAKLRKESA